MSIDTEANRKTAENIVRSEVIVCLSVLVSEALSNGWSSDNYPVDDLYSLTHKVDYREAAAHDIRERIDSADLSDPLLRDADDIDDVVEWAWFEDYIDAEQRHGDNFEAAFDAITNDRDAAFKYVKHFDVDTDEFEIESLEFWAVSPMLARDLEALGEPVLDDWFGLCVWGRQTSGQAVYMDHIMLEVADRLNKRA